MSAVSLEPMRRRHVRQVAVLENEAHRKPWSDGVFRSEIDLAAKGERHYVVARVDGEIVGYAGLMYAADEAHVTNIVVSAEYRRRGVARRLMCDLVRTAIDRGCAALTLEVRVSNDPAQALYREFGFAPAGIRQRYYENAEDAIVMWAHDIQGDDFRRRLERIEAGKQEGGAACRP